MVEKGKLQLHNSVTPALLADQYRFDMATDVPGSSFFGSYWVNIESPRYRIEEHELISVYPMAGTRGSYSGELPWAALRRRTLPWERRGSVGDRASPWLALILTLPNEATLGTAPLAAVVGATAATHFVPLPTSPVAALQFLNTSVMLSILPTEQDARLLCHVREVNLADTELAGMDDDGWVAIVMANRIVTGATETTWRATLVSLEYRDDLAQRNPQTSSVLALASWEFTSTGVGSFQELVSALDTKVFGNIEGDPTANQGVVLSRTDHAGTQTNVRYRSPMGPPAPGEPTNEPDITDLAAHELGRLMAAADGRLLRELIEWRRSEATANSRGSIGEFIARSVPRGRVARLAGETSPMHVAAALSALDHISGTRLPAARPTGHPTPRRKKGGKP